MAAFCNIFACLEQLLLNVFVTHLPCSHFLTIYSTPLNRTRTIAPVMAGFSGGAALGPAAGGVLIDSIGNNKQSTVSKWFC